jgi:hypothetical protein
VVKAPPRKEISKRARIIAAEMKHSACWFYLSFATDTAYLGSVFVWAHGIETAKRRASDLGIAFPDAEVMCSSVPRKELWRLPAGDRNRLLNAADIERLDGKRVDE